MRIVIVGAGAVGYHLSSKFSEEGHDVVLVDREADKLSRLERELNVLPICGSGASTRVLEEAGIEHTDLLLAVTDSDEVNLVACIISKNYNVKTRIARVRNEDFYVQNTSLHEKTLGIDLLISPDRAIGDEILRLSTLSGAFESAEFADGEVMVLGHTIQADNPNAGKSLFELKGMLGVIVAIIRDENTIIPRGQDVIQVHDRVYFVTRKRDLESSKGQIQLLAKEPKRVFIIGGGSIGFLVAQQMEKKHVEICLVEHDTERCQFLAENLQKTRVLNLDGLEAHDLIDEGIDRADLVISVADSDETNMLSSLLAKHHGAKKCITRISRPDFIPLLAKLGIDVALSPRLVAANMILRFVRTGGGVVSAASLLGSDAEVVELTVPDTDKFQKVTLQSIDFPKGSVLGAVVRKKNHKVLIPTGTTRLRPGDNLVIFATRAAVQGVTEFFAPE
jgi:trk system potassium uptake protein TrkA